MITTTEDISGFCISRLNDSDNINQGDQANNIQVRFLSNKRLREDDIEEHNPRHHINKAIISNNHQNDNYDNHQETDLIGDIQIDN